MNYHIFTAASYMMLAWPALGQTPDEVEKAAKLFQEAGDLYKVQDYAAALVKFKEAYFLSREAELLFNIAQCDRLLGFYAEAAASYRSFLREAPSTALADNAKARLAEMEALLSEENRAEVTLSSPLSAVEVFFDGESKGQAPITLSVSPGRHTLRFERDGYYSQEQRLMLEPKQPYSQQISLLKEPPGFFVPAVLGGSAALTGGVFLSLFLTAPQRDFEREGTTLRSLATVTDLLLVSAGATALLAWHQQKKSKALVLSKEQP